MNPVRDRPFLRRVVTPGTTRPRESVELAAALVVGLVAVAPATAWVVGQFGLGEPLPVLVGVALVGGLYLLLVVAVDRVVPGTVVATVVTATFAAEVPLGGRAGADAYPGSLGPELWLVHLPLAALLALLAIRGAFARDSVYRVEYALGAFVLWSGVVALVGPAPRPDVALFYALFSLYCLLAFAVAARSVATGVVSLPGVLGTFLVAVGGHAAFAALQVANQGLFGLSTLGETIRAGSRTVVGLGPLGEVHIGLFVSGFTGGSGPLSVLLVIALPITLAFAARRAGARRVGLLLAAVAMAAILRTTAKDAARAAAFVGVAVFVAVLLWEGRSRLAARDRDLRRLGLQGALLLAAVGSLSVPSRIVPKAGDGGTAGGGSDPTGAAGDAGGGTSISVPFFDLSTLDVRVTQYLVGADISVRNPILGVGGGNFQYVAAGYDAPGIEGVAMHNLYLSLLVGTGLPGLFLYSLAIGLVLLAGWRLLTSTAPDRTLVAGLLAGIVGFLAVSFWVLPLRFTYAIPVWFLAGALVGRARRRAGDVRGPHSEV